MYGSGLRISECLRLRVVKGKIDTHLQKVGCPHFN